MALTRYGVGSATGSGANIPDAPVDGVLYGRKDGDWSQAVEPAELAAHLADTTDAHDASAISILDVAGDFTATDVEGALAELQTEAVDGLANHLTDTIAAHSASAIYYFGSTNLAADNVEAALDELDGDHTAHLDDTTGAHAASAISIVDSVGGYAGASVEAALDEVADRIGDGSASIGFRNRIINGDMRIDQRNAGAAVTLTSSEAYGVDRWNGAEDTDGAATIQRVAVTDLAGFDYALRFTATTADASLAAAQYAYVSQPIEGNNVADLLWGTAYAKTITLSFYVRSSLTGTFGGCLRNAAANRSYPFTYTISSANTWELKTVTVAGDTSGTWLKDTSIGVTVLFGLGSGTTFAGTAGAWAAASYVTATGGTSVIGTLNATWDITGVQLEVGSVATPFERRPYADELRMCQRYHYRWDGNASADTYVGVGFNQNTTLAYCHMPFPVTMRSTVTIGTTGTAGHYGVLGASGGTTCSAVPAIAINNVNGCLVSWTVAAGLTAGQGVSCYIQTGAGRYLSFSSEI